MKESAIDYVRAKLHPMKHESVWRFNQRVLNEAWRYIHMNAMANGYKHQYVKPANRKGHLKGLDGLTGKI